MSVDSVEAVSRPMSEDQIEKLDFSGLVPATALDDEQIEQGEGFWDAHDGEQLFWQSWEPIHGVESGAVCLMHGFGEHSSRYDHVAGALCRAGYGVMTIDARGHGRSTGKRAHVERFDDYVRDFELLERKTAARWPAVERFCLGHSNGGLIVLHYALTDPDQVAGFIVTSPMCRLAMEVSPIKEAAGRLMSKVWPSFTMPSGIDAAKLSHLDRVVEKYERDPLDLKVVSAGWFSEANRAQDELFERAEELDQPFLFLVAGADDIVDSAATEEVFHAMGGSDRELEIYPGLYHEILNEKTWADIVRRMLGWMERRREAMGADEEDAT